MKLKKFILKLEEILETEKDLNKIDVRMPDNLPIKDLILKDKTIYITDEK